MPDASLLTAICRAAPSRATLTWPRDGCVSAEAVMKSPSASESFMRTGRITVFPARTPKSSSTASGGVLSRLRSGATVLSMSSTDWSSVSFSDSSFDSS